MAWLCSRVLILETAFRLELIWWVECEIDGAIVSGKSWIHTMILRWLNGAKWVRMGSIHFHLEGWNGFILATS